MTTVELGEASEQVRPGSGLRAALFARPRLLWAAALTATAVALYVCYFRQAQTQSVDSDGAAMALQGWQMLHGNWLLHGWILSDVSFYTLEVPLDMVAEAVVGLRPEVVHITSAVLYTALVLCAAMLARGRARGREGIVRALLGGGIMLAPSLASGTAVLLQSPDHTGTGVPLLLALLVLDRAPERWYVPVVMCLMLTWAQVSDPLATYAGAAGLAAACGVRACSEVARRARPPKSRWYDAALLAAAVASFAFAHGALRVIAAAGGFFVHPVEGGQGFAQLSAMPDQSWAFAGCVLLLFGADFFGQPAGVNSILGVAHLAGVIPGVWALGIGVRGFFGRLDRVTQALVAGTVVVLAAGLLGTHMAPVSGAHEIATVLPFMAALAGRLLGGRLARARLEPVLAAGLACYLGALVYNGSQPAQPPATPDLAGWLVAHHLTSGLSGYWQADVTTLDTGGRVRIAPLAVGATAGRSWESDTRWYDPAVSSADFVVTVSYPATLAFSRPAQVRAWYGRPARTYQLGGYTIMVYDYNVLRRVSPPTPSGS
jgi:hypothetical protein